MFPKKLWMPHKGKCSKACWMELEATWSRGRCPCPCQSGWTSYLWRPLPTQTTLWSHSPVIQPVPPQVQEVFLCTSEHTAAVAAPILLNPSELTVCEDFSCHLCTCLIFLSKISMLKPTPLYLPSHDVTQVGLTLKSAFIIIIACLWLSNLLKDTCEKVLLSSWAGNQ